MNRFEIVPSGFHDQLFESDASLTDFPYALCLLNKQEVFLPFACPQLNSVPYSLGWS